MMMWGMLFFWKIGGGKNDCKSWSRKENRHNTSKCQCQAYQLTHEILGSKTGFKFLHTPAILLVFHQMFLLQSEDFCFTLNEKHYVCLSIHEDFLKHLSKGTGVILCRFFFCAFIQVEAIEGDTVGCMYTANLYLVIFYRWKMIS